MEKKEFINSINRLNQKLRSMQDQDKEVISDETAAKAIIIVRNMKINDIGDVFLYAAALNLLNTWVKQDKANKKTVGYFFKGNADALVRHMLNHPDPDIDLELQQDKGMNLLVAQLGDMQFSFHQVTPGPEASKIVAKDLENPRLQFDGVRKQKVADTLFKKALENEYGRTNVMMDGTPFMDGLNEQMELYRSEKKTLADLKRTVYGKHEEPGQEHEKKKEGRNRFQAQEKAKTIEYPFRMKPSATLYENDLKTFIEELTDRSLVPFISSVYLEGYGYPLSVTNMEELKYLLETILEILKDSEHPENIGIRLEHIRERDSEYVVVILASTDEKEKAYFSAVQFCGWNTVKLTESGTVMYSDEGIETELEAYHPCRKAIAFKEYMTKGIEDDDRFSFDICVYFYDAAQADSTELEMMVSDEKLLERAPAFYAVEKEKLGAFIQESVSHENGKEALQQLRKLSMTGVSTIQNSRSSEQNYLVNAMYEYIKKGEKFLYLIDGRARTGKSSIIQMIMESLEKEGFKIFTVKTQEDAGNIPEGTDFVYYDDVIPEEIDYAKARFNVITYDPFTKTNAELDELYVLQKDAEAEGVRVYSTSFKSAVGFKDLGAGNNWLIRHFGLGLMQRQEWNEKQYPIRVLDSPEEFSQEENVAHVVIPKEIYLDKDKGEIHYAEETDGIELYKKFAAGKRGVEIVIEDEALREKIRKELESSKNRYQWINRYVEDPEGEKDLSDATDEVFKNSIVKNKYEQIAVKYLGQEAWDKLSQDSKNWLLSAMLAYNDMRNYDPMLDFSGVVVQICKAVENELASRFGHKYIEWLQKTYGDRYMEKLPEALKDDFRGVVKPVADNRITLGSLCHVMGMDGRGQIENREEYETFKKYGRECLFKNPEDTENNMYELARIIDHIRANYRNKAAHKHSIDMLVAKECLDYCVANGGRIGRMMNYMKE